MTAATAVPPGVRRLLVAHGLSATAMGLPWPALLVAVWEQTHSDAWLGATGAARMLPYAALSWLAGRLADRVARGWCVRASLVARLACVLAAAAMLTSGHVVGAIVCATVAIASGTPAYPAIAAEMPRLAGGANERATGLLVTVEVGAFFVGPALGGLALSWGALPVGCWAAVVLTAASLVLIRGIGWETSWRRGAPRPGRVAAGGRPAESRLREALSQRPAAVAAIVAVALNNAVGAGLAIALLPLADSVWRGGPGEFGIATAALGAGALISPLLLRVWGVRPPGGRRSAVVVGCMVAACTVSPGLWWAVVPLALVGAATVHVEAVATMIMQQAAPEELRSSVLGLADSVMVGAAAMAAAAAPWAASVVGPRGVMLLCAATSLAIVLVIKAPTAAGLSPGRLDVVPQQSVAQVTAYGSSG